MTMLDAQNAPHLLHGPDQLDAVFNPTSDLERLLLTLDELRCKL